VFWKCRVENYDTTMGRCWGEKHPPMSKLIRFRPFDPDIMENIYLEG